MKTAFCLLAALFTMSIAHAQPEYLEDDIQAPQPTLLNDSAQPQMPTTMPVAAVPPACLGGLGAIGKDCQADNYLEWQLEKQYWYLIGSVDTDGMKAWLRKTNSYVDRSNTPQRGRLEMLQVFGNLFTYAGGNMFNPLRSPLVGRALEASNKSTEAIPRSPNAWAFYYAIRNFIQFALGWTEQGMESIASMMMLQDRYGSWGLAGPLGAVVHLMGAHDPELVRLGIKFYQDCLQTDCEKRTSIAPYQKLGALMTQAEAHAYLGDLDAMETDLQTAEKIATAQNWPYKDEIPKVRTILTAENGLIEAWKQGKRLGAFRWPLGPAHQPIACAYCHAGADVPKHYYGLD